MIAKDVPVSMEDLTELLEWYVSVLENVTNVYIGQRYTMMGLVVRVTLMNMEQWTPTTTTNQDASLSNCHITIGMTWPSELTMTNVVIPSQPPEKQTRGAQ